MNKGKKFKTKVSRPIQGSANFWTDSEGINFQCLIWRASGSRTVLRIVRGWDFEVDYELQIGGRNSAVSERASRKPMWAKNMAGNLIAVYNFLLDGHAPLYIQLVESGMPFCLLVLLQDFL